MCVDISTGLIERSILLPTGFVGALSHPKTREKNDSTEWEATTTSKEAVEIR